MTELHESSGTSAYGRDDVATPVPIGPMGIGEEITPGAMVGPEGGEAAVGGGIASQIFRVFVENKLAVAGLLVIIFMVLFCFVGPFLYHTDQTNQQAVLATNPENQAPCLSGCGMAHTGFPLGTDGTGFDILGRLMYGGQISLIVGFSSALIATIVGVAYGAAAGFFGGWFDAATMRFVDICLSIPILFLLIALVTIFRSTVLLLILVIAAVSWLIPARLLRGETLTLRTREYVQAVRAMGGRGARIVGRHIIPNSVGTIVVFATFQIADSILLLAALGFLGLGVPAPRTDWGTMLAGGTDAAGNGYWWQIYPAALAIVLVVVAFNFVGDALRDALEVRLQRR
jgi:peptide/nickel transport system permease protein